MMPHLSVRNLSSTPISISRIETFHDPNTLQSKRSGHIFNNTTAAVPTSPALGEHSQKFTHQDVDITLKPFESYTLDQEKQDCEEDDDTPPSATLRLTLETSSGERYRIDTHPSYTQRSTHTLTALCPSPSTRYTALFHPSRPTPHLTIHSNHQINYNSWMAGIPDTMPLSALSIPGTHNSHTHYRALPSVRCQHVDVRTQLDNGIRFLDIRLQPVHATDATKKDLYLVHGAFPVSLTGPKYFEPVLQMCYDFLGAHPSETILISLKREGIGGATDEHLAQILEEHYLKRHPSRWYTAPWTPYLGAVRGKLILLRRYNTTATTHTATSPTHHTPATTTTTTTTTGTGTGTGTGIDATAWPSNATNALFPSHAPTSSTQLCLQDACDLSHPSLLPTKIAHCTAHLARAASLTHPIPGTTTDVTNPVPPAPLHLNFLSASNFWKKGCWPGNVARVVNRSAEEWICGWHHLEEKKKEEEEKRAGEGQRGTVRRRKEGDGGTGVVIMDCVGEGAEGWDLVGLIVGCNMGVLGKVGGEEWW